MIITAATTRGVVWEGPQRMAAHTLDVPELTADQVLVRVESIGLCGTDLAVWRGDSGRVRPRTVIGHEFGGIVVDRGAGAGDVRLGRPVAIDPNLTCRRCETCRAGTRGRCPERRLMGIDVGGGLRGLAVVDVDQLIPLDDATDPRALALVEPVAVGVRACAQAGVRPGQVVGIIGGGAIGMAAARQARELGAECIVLEPDTTRRAAIADYSVTPATHRSWPDRRFDAVIDTVGTGETVETAIAGVADGRTICVVGLARGGSMPGSEQLVRRELRLAGSFCYTRADLETAAGLVARHGLAVIPVDVVIGIERATDVFRDLADGRRGRGKALLVPDVP